MSVLSYALRAFGADPATAAADDERAFVAPSAIRDLLARANPGEDFRHARMLLIFRTSTQQTWLVATSASLYCVLDNRRQKHARMLWRIPREEIEKDGRIGLQINEAELSERDRYLMVGSKRPRKFTAALFQTQPIKDSVEELLRDAFEL